MFEAGLLTVGAVAVGDIDAHDRGDDFVQLRRLHDHAEVAGEGFVASRAAEGDAEHHFIAHVHGLAADVVGVFDGADQATAVVGDIEFARQIVERAIVDDDLTHLRAEGHDVDDLLRVDAGSRIGGEVADVIRTGAARVQSDGLDAPQKIRRILRLNEAHLEIGPGGDLDVAGGELLRDLREFAELKGADQSARNPQPRHERLLVWREVKKAVPFEAEDFLLLRRFVGGGVLEQDRVGVERMQFLLHPLLENQVFVRHLSFDGRGRFHVGETLAARGNPREEPREVIGLVRGEHFPVDGIDWDGVAHGQ